MRMTYTEFGQFIAELMELARDPLPEQSFDDLGFDSIQIFDVLCSVEDLGIEIPDELFSPSTTFGAVFATYTDPARDSEQTRG